MHDREPAFAYECEVAEGVGLQNNRSALVRRQTRTSVNQTRLAIQTVLSSAACRPGSMAASIALIIKFIISTQFMLLSLGA